ncbi:MAG: hypothetical protein HY367_02485 [Candidatus Aenigmarchaeota archaeon]|nr:hypothetical protein [Candidatus Aenigmarchaeota archaeon]
MRLSQLIEGLIAAKENVDRAYHETRGRGYATAIKTYKAYQEEIDRRERVYRAFEVPKESG